MIPTLIRMRVVALVVGVVLTLATFGALVQSVLVPRGSTAWIARGVNSFVNVLNRAPLRFMKTYRAQDRWLIGAAPVSVILQLTVYVIVLILTMGLVVFGTSNLSLGDSLYQSGSTLTTLGIVEPVTDVSSVVCFVAAFLGLVVIAVFIGYLLAIYSSYAARESQMERLALLAGEPAWGPEVLARGHLLKLPGSEIPAADIWIDWICDIRMNQRVNPVLSDLRSSSPYRHWAVTMLAVTDSAALRLALQPTSTDPKLVLLIAESTLAAHQLRNIDHRLHNWQIQAEVQRILSGDANRPVNSLLTDDEWRDGVSALEEVGYVMPGELDQARERFERIRTLYAADVYHLTKSFHAIPAPWSGPRVPALPVMRPERATNEVST